MRFSPRWQRSYEVVGVKEVQPTFTELPTEDIQIMRASNHLVVSNCTYEMKQGTASDCRHALIAARAQYMRDISPANELLCEGWKLTVMRKADRTKMIVSYIGQPAMVSSRPAIRLPPFIDILKDI
ncbi:hypothetical protein RSOLAG22IIIB_01411 [Rhizoctonia solani]|uniref:Uncharacterized protein n=1 Tax=Rhizoctonia solani TaxID=456999 RepID=A0A0K6G5Y6_9AGAM|nr:unnamed protein product [Rhizoctonia solani]CUA73890.1 hypothetical protein RSOLAG22IIIB_01411 [Rhizoctonia solani]